jgi:hypothetical protein
MQRLCFKQGWLSLAVSQVGQCSSFNSGFSITRGACLKPMLLQELLEKVPPGQGVPVCIPLFQLPRLDTHLPQESPHLMAPTFAMCSIASWLLSASTSQSCAISAASPGIYTFCLSQLWDGAITLVTPCFIWNSRSVPVREVTEAPPSLQTLKRGCNPTHAPRSSFLGIFTATKHNGMTAALCDKVMERMKDALWNQAHLSKHLGGLRRN